MYICTIVRTITTEVEQNNLFFFMKNQKGKENDRGFLPCFLVWLMNFNVGLSQKS